jgi:hypothetical protein
LTDTPDEPSHQEYDLPYRKKRKTTQIVPKIQRNIASATEAVSEKVASSDSSSCHRKEYADALYCVDSAVDDVSDDPWMKTDEAESQAFWGCHEDTGTSRQSETENKCMKSFDSSRENVRIDAGDQCCVKEPVAPPFRHDEPSVAAPDCVDEHVSDKCSTQLGDDALYGVCNNGEQGTDSNDEQVSSLPHDNVSGDLPVSDDKTLKYCKDSEDHNQDDRSCADSSNEDAPAFLDDSNYAGHDDAGKICIIDDTDDSDIDDELLQTQPKWQTVLRSDPYPLSEHLLLSMEEVSELIFIS